VRAVNLLPPDERRKGLEEGARTPLLLAAGGIALVTIAATFFASMASVSASGTRSDRDDVQAALAALPQLPDQAVSQNALVKERSDRVAALAAALDGRVPFDRLLRQVSYVLPEDAWLTQLDAKAPVTESSETAPAAAVEDATDVTIQGATWSHDKVAVVLARLSAVPSLASVRLTGSTRMEPAADSEPSDSTTSDTPGRPFVTFVVSATLRTEASS
jgi:Tfp pilus assembly protein PilN